MITNRIAIVLIFLVFLVSCVSTEPVIREKEILAENVQIVELSDNAEFYLTAGIVTKELNGFKLKMYAYNNQIPGPLLMVKQNSSAIIRFKNLIDMPTTIHWHGIRVANENDGVAELTQNPILPGEIFIYNLTFPDPGVYWYHPHMREDMQQELGLYGNIIVKAEDEVGKVGDAYAIFLDDILLVDNKIAPFYEVATHAIMGRFGNLMLINGELNYSFSILTGKIIRLYLTNAANTRVFNFSVTNSKLKVLGGDSGFYNKDFFTDSVILAPSERAIVELTFDNAGTYVMEHRTPLSTYVLGKIHVAGLNEQDPTFDIINAHNIFDEDFVNSRISSSPDFEFILDVEMPMMRMMGRNMMHASPDGIEWEDTIPMMNSMSSGANTKWIIRDVKTKKENEQIKYTVRVGEWKKVRFINNAQSMHPMQHPIHLHGQRFLVLSVDGVTNKNLVWKDTVLVPEGKEVDILIDFTNKGLWPMHCHIAEHLESGMMMVWQVDG